MTQKEVGIAIIKQYKQQYVYKVTVQYLIIPGRRNKNLIWILLINV